MVPDPWKRSSGKPLQSAPECWFLNNHEPEERKRQKRKYAKSSCMDMGKHGMNSYKPQWTLNNIPYASQKKKILPHLLEHYRYSVRLDAIFKLKLNKNLKVL